MTKSFKRELLFTLFITFLTTSLIFLGYALKTVAEIKDIQPDKVIYVHDMPKTEVKTETEIKTVTKFVPVKTEPRAETIISEDDKRQIAKVVHAEAGNQDDIGRRLVADVVLNRIDSDRFPDTVTEVIAQDNQFKSAAKYTEADMQAVEDELQKRLDHGVIWFKTGSYHNIGTELYQHGDHYFSGE